MQVQPQHSIILCLQVQLQREIKKWGERYENDIEEQEQMLESLKKSRAEVISRDIRRDTGPR